MLGNSQHLYLVSFLSSYWMGTWFKIKLKFNQNVVHSISSTKDVHRMIVKSMRPYWPSLWSAHSVTNPSRFGQTPITLIDSRHSGPGYKYKGLQQFGALSICTMPLASQFEAQADQATLCRANPRRNARDRCMPRFLLEIARLYQHWEPTVLSTGTSNLLTAI